MLRSEAGAGLDGLARRPGRNYLTISLRRLLSNRVGVVCLTIIILMYGGGLLAPVVTPYGYNEQNLEAAKQSPSFAHPFGTDRLGRDILTRVIYGLRTTVISDHRYADDRDAGAGDYAGAGCGLLRQDDRHDNHAGGGNYDLVPGHLPGAHHRADGASADGGMAAGRGEYGGGGLHALGDRGLFRAGAGLGAVLVVRDGAAGARAGVAGAGGAVR